MVSQKAMKQDLTAENIKIRIRYTGVQSSCVITYNHSSGDVSSAIGEKGLEKPDPEFTSGAISGTISMVALGGIKEFVNFVNDLEHYGAEVYIAKALQGLMPNAKPIRS